MAVTLDRAVVVGASMAGLLAACALSGHCSEVVVVERDRLSPTTQQRRGVPQARHVHALLARGREVLEQYFPGFTAEVLERGGLTADAVQGGRFFMGGDFLLSYDSGLTLLCASRPLLEAVTRERVARLDNVRFVDDTTAVGLTAREGCVTGLLTRPAQGGEQQQLASSLVVGATGRSAGGLRWLAELGYAEPAEERIEVDLTYVRRTFRRRPHHLDGARFLMITPQPPGLRAAAVFAQEDDLWRVTLAGYLGEQPPRDLEGFRQYAAGLPTPEVGDLLAAAEPVDEPATAHFPASRRRRFDRMTRHPDGFLAFGDALCSFNPVYGQGMTVAALESLALRRVLQEGGAASLARLTLRLPRSSTCRGRWPPAAICAFRRYPAHGRCATGSSTPTSTGSSSPLVTTGSSRTRSHGRTTCSTRPSPCCGPPSPPRAARRPPSRTDPHSAQRTPRTTGSADASDTVAGAMRDRRR